MIYNYAIIIFILIFSLPLLADSPRFEWRYDNGKKFKYWTITNEEYFLNYNRAEASQNRFPASQTIPSDSDNREKGEKVDFYFKVKYGFTELNLEDRANESIAVFNSNQTLQLTLGALFQSHERSFFSEITTEKIDFKNDSENFKSSSDHLLGLKSGLLFGDSNQWSFYLAYSDYQFIHIKNFKYNIDKTSLASTGLSYKKIIYDGIKWNASSSFGCQYILGSKNDTNDYLIENGHRCQLDFSTTRNYKDKKITIGLELDQRKQNNSIVSHEENKVLFNLGINFDF